MALIEIKCSVETLEEYFNRATFKVITNEFKSNLKLLKEIMEKYLHPLYKNFIVFSGNKYDMDSYLDKYTNIIFDFYSEDLFLGVKNKTIIIKHEKPSKINLSNKSSLFSEETLALIKRKIIYGQGIKGIESIEKNIIATFKFLFPIEAFKHKWIVDLDYAYLSDRFDFAGLIDATIKPKFSTIEKKQMLILYADKGKEILDLLNPTAVYRSNNKKIMKEIPYLIKRGDPIDKVYKCEKGIIIEKQTEVTWVLLYNQDLS